MAGRFEVHVRGRRAITCTTRDEANDWADLLGTDRAPASIRDTAPPAPAPVGADPRQQTIFNTPEDLA